MHGVLMSEYCKPLEQMKAWSMKFGHDGLKTTTSSHGPVSLEWQGELMAAMEMNI